MNYSDLARLYSELESTTKRLEKTWLVSKFLKAAPAKELNAICLLLQGRIFPTWDQRTIGVAARIMLKAISLATGITIEKIEDEWKKVGDLGKVTEQFISRKKQATLARLEISVSKVFENLQKLTTLEGKGMVEKKIQLIAELLTSASPIESRYIARSVLEDLRVGVAYGTMRDAIVCASFGEKIDINYDEKEKSITPEDREVYTKYCDLVQPAYDMTNDFSVVALAAREKGERGLENMHINVGTPLKVMLYTKAKGLADAFKTVGIPAAIEYKYDGFRIQAHKKNNKITLYTRRLEDVTAQFPEVVESVKKNVKGESFVIESEAVAFDSKTGKYRPFQDVSQRIKRKYDIEKIAEKFPVELNVFDIDSFEGKDLMETAFRERRELLKKMIIESPKKIVLAKQLITDDLKKAEKFYEESLAQGQEGVMLKNLEGIYRPGARVGYGVKVKPIMETLDLVIVGGEWGTGKRSGWLSSFVIACKDENSGELVEIGRVGTGFKELEGSGVSFEQMTELLKPLILEEKGREVRVRPEIVIEISYEEVQRSPTYSSGYALRFPRLVRLRTEDKTVNDVNTVADVEELFYAQRGGR